MAADHSSCPATAAALLPLPKGWDRAQAGTGSRRGRACSGGRGAVETHPRDHSITESGRLEKTSQIMKSNCHPNTPTPAKPCPEVPHRHLFQPLQGWGLPHCPGQPGPTPDHSFSKEIFPHIQPKPPLTQLEAMASRLLTGYLGNRPPFTLQPSPTQGQCWEQQALLPRGLSWARAPHFPRASLRGSEGPTTLLSPAMSSQ